MMKEIEMLQLIALRYNALFVSEANTNFSKLTGETLRLVDTLSKHGFVLSEELLHAINHESSEFKENIKKCVEKILGTKLNWTPLVKNWEIPTGENVYDHWITAWWNKEIEYFPDKLSKEYYFDGVFPNDYYEALKLECGHLIPVGTFPIHRYNGCPFCGKPFVFDEKLLLESSGSKKRLLSLWKTEDFELLLNSLLSSKMVLDETQTDTVKKLLKFYLPPNGININSKETLMILIDELLNQGKKEEVGMYFRSANDILRYLWYKKTGFIQLVEPKTIIKANSKNHKHITRLHDLSSYASMRTKDDLKLKYSRTEAKMVARWLNNLPFDEETMAEQMHPKRGIWIRFIRALRLAEYSKKAGFERLKLLLDVFYNQVYEVWQGRVNYYRFRSDAKNTFSLLQQRPSLFARSLFANMLWFGAEETLNAFSKVSEKVPMRLILTLNSFAELYFDKNVQRSVKTILGNRVSVPANKYLSLYEDEKLKDFQGIIRKFTEKELNRRFSLEEEAFHRIYIDEKLENIPFPIGDRSQNLQDLNPTFMGEKIPLEGKMIRLYMQWGEGLPAQHLDMDLSAAILYKGHTEICNYANLTPTGCKHSGDIREIPNKVGTAEYIELNLNELRKVQAKFVVFTCNAYSSGSITPSLVVGWMDSKYKMKVSERTGVAYDPSCVIHQVRIAQPLQKGLVFGVLDVQQEEIIWLEMPFEGQTVGNLSEEEVLSFLQRISAKISIGKVLRIKSEAQNWEIVNKPELADMVFDVSWAKKYGNLNNLLVD